MGMDLGT